MQVTTIAVVEATYEVDADNPVAAFEAAQRRYLDGDYGDDVHAHRFGPIHVGVDEYLGYFLEPYAAIVGEHDDGTARLGTGGFVVRLTDGRHVAHGATPLEALGAVTADRPRPISEVEASALHGEAAS